MKYILYRAACFQMMKKGHACLSKTRPFQSVSGFYPHKPSRVSIGEASPGMTGSTRTP